jgi:hypothetical protein
MDEEQFLASFGNKTCTINGVTMLMRDAAEIWMQETRHNPQREESPDTFMLELNARYSLDVSKDDYVFVIEDGRTILTIGEFRERRWPRFTLVNEQLVTISDYWLCAHHTV